MSTTWKGQLSFGVLTVPVKIATAIPRKPSLFGKAHKKCGTRLNQKSYCSKCEVLVENEDVIRQAANGETLTDAFIAKCKPESDKKIHITGLVKSIDPVHFETPYALVPDNSAGLVSVIAQAIGSRFATGRVVLQGRDVNVAVCVRDGMLMLWRLRRPSEIAMVLQQPEKVKRADVAAVRSLLAGFPSVIEWVADSYADKINEFASNDVTIGKLVEAAKQKKSSKRKAKAA